MSAYCGQCQVCQVDDIERCTTCGSTRPPRGWPTDALIGQVLKDRWRVDARLGGSSFEMIYAGVDLGSEQSVTIHSLLPAYHRDEPRLQRFVERAQVLRQLSDPATGRLVGAMEDGGVVAYVTETYRQTLADVVLEPLPIEMVLFVGSQVARSLAEAHGAGIVHGHLELCRVDARSDGPSMTVKVRGYGDGLVHRSHPGAPRPARRTPAFVAPELVSGGAPTEASDRYALGVLLYFLAAGQLPWDGEDAMALLREKGHRPPPSLRSVVPHAPERFAALVDSLMAVEPADRWPTSAAEVARDLEAQLVGLGSVLARRPPARRRAGAVRAVALGVAAGLVLGVGGALAWRLAAGPKPVESTAPPARLAPVETPGLAPTVPVAPDRAHSGSAPFAPRPRADRPSTPSEAPR